jgi:hypothetical protein
MAARRRAGSALVTDGILPVTTRAARMTLKVTGGAEGGMNSGRMLRKFRCQTRLNASRHGARSRFV